MTPDLRVGLRRDRRAPPRVGLSGVLIFDIPLEEFLFGVAFGLHWSAIYEHYTWTEGVVHAGQGHRSPTRAKVSDRRI